MHCSVAKHSTEHAVLVCLIFLQIDPKSGEVMKSNEQAQAECLQLVSAGTDGYATESPQMLLHFVYIRTYVCTYWFRLCKGLSCSGTYALLHPSQAPSPPTLVCRLTYTLTSHGSPSSRYLSTYLCTHLNRYVHTRKRLSVHSIQYCNVHTIQHICTLHTILLK